MAVQFLTGLNVNGNINLNTNQLQNVVIQPLGADPASITGRIYYNSGTNKLKIYNGTDWVAFQTGTDGDTTYDLTGVGSTDGTAGVRLTETGTSNHDDVLIIGGGTTGVTRSGNTLTVTSNDEFDGTVTSVAQTHAGNAFSVTGSPITGAGTLAIGMAGTAAQYITGQGNLATFPTIPTVGDGTLTVQGTGVLGGTGTFTANQSGNTTISVTHDAQSQSDTTPTTTLTHGGTFTALSANVDVNASGHVTGQELTTFTLPSDQQGVTSINFTTDGSALNVNSNTITTSGTMTGVWQGATTEYVNGEGDLVTFPTIPQGDITAVTVTAPITGGGTSGSVAIGHASQTDTESTDAATLTFGGTFDAYTDVTTNATGHVTGHNVKTFTLPANPNVNTTSLPVKNSAGTLQFTSTQATGIRFAASGSASVSFTSATQVVTFSSTNTDETYTLPVSAGTAVTGYTVADIDLTAGGTGSGIKSRVTFAGKDENILITDTVGNNGVVKIALTDSVTIVDSLTVDQDIGVGNDLTVSGQGSFSGQVTVPTANTGTSAPNLAQVELLIAGIGIFQGAYNASTGQAAAGPITGTSNIALDLGDYFVVSVAGTAFFSVTLEPGDFIFANADIAANSNPSVGDYTVVQADANIAGAGATDGATQKGVAGFDSANFTVSAAGWVQLNDQSITATTYGSASKTVALAINADGITTTAAEQDIAITASQVTDLCAAVNTCIGSNSVTANIGNGTLVAYPINHNFNTRNVVVTCFRNSTPWDTVVLDVERTSVNQVILRSTTALTTNQVSVIITKVV